MDPGLWEVMRGDADAVEVVARLRGDPPPELRIVARFGAIATGRVAARDIPAVRVHPAVRSLKAATVLAADGLDAPPRLPVARPVTDGAGVLLGVVDWGLDLGSPAFRDAAGATRVEALWDQRAAPEAPPAPYGYGRLLDRAAIDRALAAPNPYHALRYHPAEVDPSGQGAHGTHVLDIAGGSPRHGVSGVAPGASLAFVHLADPSRLDNALGTSVRLLEAVHFLGALADERPCVVNLSLGRHAGPHDGQTLVELAFEEWILARPGRVLVQSAGNYHEARAHAVAELGADPVRVAFELVAEDPTADELDLWYPAAAAARVRVWSPDGELAAELLPGDRRPIRVAGIEVGRGYHRARDPNNGDHNVHLFFDAHPDRPAGRWELELVALGAVGGTAHLWLERDPVRAGQARFEIGEPSTTTGTICNAPSAITVGAIDAATGLPASFTSAGPTRDGRPKPDLCAPGVHVSAARSAGPGAEAPDDARVAKSGSSMAAPHVAGAAARLLGLAPELTAAEVRALLVDSAEPLADPSTAAQLGRGVLRADRAVERLASRRAPPDAVESASPPPSPPPPTLETPVYETDESWSDPPFPFGDDFPESAPSSAADPVPGWLGGMAQAAGVFDEVHRSGRLPPVVSGSLALMGVPGEACRGALLPGDVVVVRALGEGRVAVAYVIERPEGPRAWVRSVSDGRRVVRSLLDGPRLRRDVLWLRPLARELPGEVLPTFEPSAFDERPRDFVEMPFVLEGWVPNAAGTGLSLFRVDVRTGAQMAALGRTFTATNPTYWQVNAGTGRIEASLELLVYHPATTAGGTTFPPGRHPLAVIVHGNHDTHDGGAIGDPALEIHNHHGYSARGGAGEYLQEALARIGVVSVSVSTNPANAEDLAFETRGHFVVAAIRAMQDLARTDPRYRNHIDFSRVALIGHSRGGDAVVAALAHLPAHVTVKTVVQLAPTDQTGLLTGSAPAAPPLPAGAPPVTFVTRPMTLTARSHVMQLILWGSRDGDVSGLQDVRVDVSVNPFRHYDRSSAQRALQFWHGATHNRFNRVWTDATEGPLVQLADPALLALLMPRSDQEGRTVEALRAWIGFTLHSEAGEAAQFDGRRATAVATSLPIAGMWKFGRRLETIDRFEDTRLDRNTLGGATIVPSGSPWDEVLLANENPAGAGITDFQFPHIDRCLRFSPPPVAVPGSFPPSPAWKTTLPAGHRDLSRFDLLTFRVAKRYVLAQLPQNSASSVLGVNQPVVRVRLVPHAGTPHTAAAVGLLSALPIPRLFSPPVSVPMGSATVSVSNLTKYHLETWQVELAPYRAAIGSLANIEFVEIEIDTEPGQPVFVDTLSLVRRP